MPTPRVPGRPPRAGLFRRRRRVPVGTWDFIDLGGDVPPRADGTDGGAGVREPRRPRPTLPCLSVALDLPAPDSPA